MLGASDTHSQGDKDEGYMVGETLTQYLGHISYVARLLSWSAWHVKQITYIRLHYSNQLTRPNSNGWDLP